MDDLTAVEYAREALEGKGNRGFVKNFRYIRMPERQGVRITFLDCGRKMDLYYDFVTFSIGMSALGYAVTAVAVCFFAGKFIRPVAESYDMEYTKKK